jgi:hypothetical protein
MRGGILLLLLLMATAILTMSGCSTTLVEALPTGKTTRCDAAWPGRWKVIEQNQGNADSHEWLQINADCTQMTFTGPEKTQTEQHTLTLISTRAGDFLTFSSPGDKPACLEDDNTHCGTELMRYVHAGNQISLYRPDHRKVHDALESHTVSGYTEMNQAPSTTDASTTNSATINSAAINSATPTVIGGTQTGKPPVPTTIIAGNPEQIATILSQPPEFFESTPSTILQRYDPMTEGKNP